MRPIVNMAEKDQATDIGNMHKKFGKDRACRSGDILMDRQTDRQTYSSQYFATAPAGKVKIAQWLRGKQKLRISEMGTGAGIWYNDMSKIELTNSYEFYTTS